MGAAGKAEIPVIDIGELIAGGSDQAVDKIGAAIREACVGTGFFYIANHGVPSDLVDAAFDANRSFHALPVEEKLKVRRNMWHRGYSPFAASILTSSARFEAAKKPNQLESITLGHEISPDHPDYEKKPLQGPNQWPANPAAFKPDVQRYEAAVRKLGLQLLKPLSRAVGEDRHFFEQYAKSPATSLRLIHYPEGPAVRQEDLYGIHPHTDYGFLTILAQDDVGGLQVRRVDDSWIPAPYIPDTFVVNVGDALARWTNDVFNSTPHRVVGPVVPTDRYSIAYFFGPSLDADIAPLASFIGAQQPARHAPIKYGDYFAMRLDANHPERQAAAAY